MQGWGVLNFRTMNYVKGVLSGFAAIFIAEVAFLWPLLKGSKATGMAVFLGILLFALFFAASRSRPALRVLFFWIPTLVTSTLGFAFVGMLTYLWISFRHQ